MYIRKLIVKNFKVLRETVIEFNQHLNLIVGDNEAGKSTLLEANHLVMTGQLNGRNVLNELTPHIFNADVVREYLENLRNGISKPPPGILIEAYLAGDVSLSQLKGVNNSLKEDCPGISLRIEFDDEYGPEYGDYISDMSKVSTLPVEYYVVRWYSFANNAVTVRSVPIKSTLIDTGQLRAINSTDRYISNIINGVLEPKEKVELSLSYRKLKDEFLRDASVKKINSHLGTKKGDVTDKALSISMDISSRSAWESNLTPHLNEIPFAFAGKGEQSAVNMKLAIEGSGEANIVLIEEPENHQSFTNMNSLIGKIGEKTKQKQIFIATHSSFVLNKLGVDNVILFSRGKNARLSSLSLDTQDYFMKLPGHDTLRLILTQKAILVEGPSDELIVQKAFLDKYGKSALESRVDIISVQSLAFKRFLEIGRLLNLDIRVVTDNDGDVNRLAEKYKDYLGNADTPKIKICYDGDERYKTLEPQLLKANSLQLLNQIFGTSFVDDIELLDYMSKNKTDCALQIFNSSLLFNYPRYIIDAIS